MICIFIASLAFRWSRPKWDHRRLNAMYRGELILRGIPEIEPMDVLLIMDHLPACSGPSKSRP
jgi:hypothetical protein